MTNRIPANAGCYLDEYDAPRFWRHVNLEGGMAYLDDEHSSLTKDAGQCWVWTGWVGGAKSHPYGRFNVFGSASQAHRISLQEFGVIVPPDLVVDHLCRNTLCVRPNHLEVVTQDENMKRGTRASGTHCKNGHEYTPDNTRIQTRGDKRVRLCRTCRRGYSASANRRSRERLLDAA